MDDCRISAYADDYSINPKESSHAESCHRKKIHSELERMPLEKQRQVLNFAKILASAKIKRIPAQKFLRFVGVIENQDLDSISQAIDEDCGKVNLHDLLADVKLDVGDEVNISVKEGTIIVAPAKRERGRHNLKDLVARIPERYQPGEVDWGKPFAKNEW